MKHLILLVLFCTSSLVAVDAQPRGDAEATYGLKGPVRSFRTETATVVVKDGQTSEGPRVLKMTAEFDQDGNRTDFGMYDDKGVLVRRIVMKFDGPRMTEFVNYDGSGNAWLSGKQDYDSAGRIIGTTTYNGDQSLRSKKVYRRNEQGQVIEWAEYAADGVVLDKMTNTFTSSGRPNTSEREQRSPNGLLVSREFHDGPQQLVEIVTYKPDGSVLAKSVRVGQQISEYAEDGSLRRSTSFSNQGRLPDSIMVDANGSRKRESQIPDQIDSHGNWVKQTQWLTDANGTRAVTVTYRTLNYYEK